ncbi:hypothetical protein J4464_04900 [Candidatus Woesearchaeota archaeon]|nr:hypothetical protein [Candidatus Woesearchaeota archaeon]
MKKRLTATEEFEIMKLVLDKFLWLGFIIMAFGLYKMYTATMQEGITFIAAGAIVLVIFLWLIVKEFEVLK